MTQAQKVAKDKFKKAIEYRKKTGVSLKEAFAHIYGKKVGAVKKKAAPKKKADAKAKYVKILGQEVKEGTKLHQKLVDQKKYFDDLKKSEVGKISSSLFYKQQKAFEKQKKVNDSINKKFANWNYPVPPVYTGNWTIKTWTDYITKNGSKIGAIKKAAPKKKSAPKKVASKRITDIHKDSKSHNVNIKVVSGVEYTKSEYLQEIEDVKKEILKQTKDLEKLQKAYKETKDKVKKEYLKNDIGVLKYNFIPHNKRYLISLKSTLKKSI
jgi:hypothetical protein